MSAAPSLEAAAAAPPPRADYWNVNIRPDQYTAECPEWMVDIDDCDKYNLGTLDADFRIMTWERVRQIVALNRLDLFRRVPSNLRLYLEYMWRLRQKWGSVMRFIVDERLKWGGGGGSGSGGKDDDDLAPRNPTPFADPADYRMLLNDWPYALAAGIVHVVVWVKFRLEEDPQTGDMTDGTRASIDAFVAETFHSHVAPEDVLWFRNWSSLKSIHAVEHFHVMLNNPDPAFVKEITNGDVPMIDKV